MKVKNSSRQKDSTFTIFKYCPCYRCSLCSDSIPSAPYLFSKSSLNISSEPLSQINSTRGWEPISRLWKILYAMYTHHTYQVSDQAPKSFAFLSGQVWCFVNRRGKSHHWSQCCKIKFRKKISKCSLGNHYTQGISAWAHVWFDLNELWESNK